MADTRHKDAVWTVCGTDGHTTYEGAQLAVLMDIRDALKEQTRILRSLEELARCPNVQRGFIAMNKLRLHVEKYGVAPKGKK